jgi:sodium transport system permease protein
MLAMFTLLYPAIIGFTMHQLIDKNTKHEREGIELAVIGGPGSDPDGAAGQKNINVKDTAPMEEARHRRTAARQEGGGGAAPAGGVRRELLRDASGAPRDLVRFGGRKQFASAAKIEEVLQAYSSNVASARLLAHGVSPAGLTPIQLQRYDTGSTAARSAASSAASSACCSSRPSCCACRRRSTAPPASANAVRWKC